MANKRTKYLAAKDRAVKVRRNMEEELELARNLRQMQRQVGGFARPGTVAKPGLRKRALAEEQAKRFGVRLAQESPRRGPARADPPPKDNMGPRYEGEMAERQRAAYEKTRELKNRVAPLGNKMGAQYMTDTDLADFEKGLLRRRT